MKTLDLNQMGEIQGEGGFWTAFTCGLGIVAAGAVLAGTGGTGALISAYVAGAACGASFGYAGATGSFL